MPGSRRSCPSDGLETLQSCQREPGKRDGYVYFACGDWNRVCRFVFQEIGPTLKSKVDEDAKLVVEVTSADAPMAKLSFKAEAASHQAGRLVLQETKRDPQFLLPLRVSHARSGESDKSCNTCSESLPRVHDFRAS